jgi:crotonobetainyl-CoA:carnitine CoA-transferase CaiB-like acyl-CoA transferase
MTDAPARHDRALPLGSLRVLDMSEQIAGPYASKLLADAGADVIKVERSGGDPLRRWSASGADLAGGDGALFCYLNTSKRSIIGDIDEPGVRDLLAGADVLIEDGRLTDDQIATARRAHPALLVTSISPFGRTGPWAERPATEFTLQALCGSTASRGTPDREPLHAGGRLGEWICGTSAAVAILAASRSGRGDHIDVSMLEAMTPALSGFVALQTALFGVIDAARRSRRPYRSIETPGIERTKDGLVGLTTVTRQQFNDLLTMVGRPDLEGDERYGSAEQRNRRVSEFRAITDAWISTRTTAEVEELASLLRIPVAAVGTPETVTSNDHLVARGVYVQNPSGQFRQPRVPYRISGLEPRPFEPAPALDQHRGQTWVGGANAAPGRGASDAATDPAQPLTGIRVIDLTAFWAGPSATFLLAALGADVIKVESTNRPDGMRFTSARTPADDQWWEHSGWYQANNANKRDITLDLDTREGRRLLLDLVATADLVVENFSPRVLSAFDLGWDAISAANPQVSLVRMPGFGLDGPWRDRSAFAQTIEQASGMAWLTGFADSPPLVPRGVCDPVAGMHAAFAGLVALADRQRSGQGHLVEATMFEAALNISAELVIERDAYRATLARDANRGPVAAPQGVYACEGTERWLALAVTDDDQWQTLCRVLDQPGWAAEARWSSAGGRHAHHDAIDRSLGPVLAQLDADDLSACLLAAGVPAEAVVSPAWVPENPQLRARGFVEVVEHPLLGRLELYGLPYRFASRPEPWIRRPAPLLGQDNDEILTSVLGLDDDQIAALRQAHVIGERLGGD